MGCGASVNYPEKAYEKFKNDAEDKEALILRSYFRAISNSFHDMENKEKAICVDPIINQAGKHGQTPRSGQHGEHKGMSTLEYLIAAVFGANLGGIQRDENAKISMEVWCELCKQLQKECEDFWSHEDEAKLIQRITEMCIKVGHEDMSWCKKVRLFCRLKEEGQGKFFFAKVESKKEDGVLTYPGKPDEEADGVSPAGWINYRCGAEDGSTAKLQIDILEWESGVWNQKTVEVAPSMVFDVEGG